MPRESSTVVGVVAGSHVLNHSYLILVPPAFSFIGPDLGVSTAALGFAVGLLGAVVTLLQLPFGYLSDAYSRSLVLGISLSFGALGAGMAALAPTYEWLLLAHVVMGIGVAGHHPAHYPLLAAATDESARGRAYSVHGFAGAVGLAAPFAVVPLVIRLGGTWRVAFGLVALVGALYGVVSLLAMRRTSREITHPEDPAERPALTPGWLATWARSLPRRAVGGVRTLLGSTTILLLTLLWFADSVAAWGVRAYAPTLLEGAYGVAPETATLYGAAMLGVGAVLLLAGGWLSDVVGAPPVLYLGYGSLVVLAAALAAGLPTVAALAVVLLLAATIDISRPARSMLTDRASARADVGKNFALMTIGISLGGAVAPPLFGVVIEQQSVELAFFAVAAVAAAAFGLSVAVAYSSS
ncbi:MFS transporter [Natronomonas sp. EA1]|uniref:MFS transporter n=1 Tax=Natronomonas sp. EA1 TaxID=3421655 RepID=UPI003EBED69D